MTNFDFPQVPENPKLKFGVTLENVWKKGELHPGLKDLFLKAYLNASGEESDDINEDKNRNKFSIVLEALTSGPKGQGYVSQRISLKEKLESGKWILASSTPPGAPLWLIRHFLGRLPVPLLQGSHWQMLAVDCDAVSIPDEILHDVKTATEALTEESYLILTVLVLLIRNLSMLRHPNGETELNEETLKALSQYFIASIISRPYRPGLFTPFDKECQPLLVFLAKHWLKIKSFQLNYEGDKNKIRNEFEKYVSKKNEISDSEEAIHFIYLPKVKIDKTTENPKFLVEKLSKNCKNNEKHCKNSKNTLENSKKEKKSNICGTQTFECDFKENVETLEKKSIGKEELQNSNRTVKEDENSDAIVSLKKKLSEIISSKKKSQNSEEIKHLRSNIKHLEDLNIKIMEVLNLMKKVDKILPEEIEEINNLKKQLETLNEIAEPQSEGKKSTKDSKLLRTEFEDLKIEELTLPKKKTEEIQILKRKIQEFLFIDDKIDVLKKHVVIKEEIEEIVTLWKEIKELNLAKNKKAKIANKEIESCEKKPSIIKINKNSSSSNNLVMELKKNFESDKKKPSLVEFWKKKKVSKDNLSIKSLEVIDSEDWHVPVSPVNSI